jgi:hypothetical protein
MRMPLISCLVTFTFGILSLPALGGDQSLNCRIQKICPGGATISCEGKGSASQCDILPSGVSCRYYINGELFVDEERCPSFDAAEVAGPEPGEVGSKAVSDAEVIVRRSDGQYDVKCNDGSRERVSKEQLDSGEICKGRSSNGRFQIKCDGFGSNYYPARSSDGRHFGTFITAQECREIAEVSINQTTCGSVMPGTFHIFRISDGARLGDRATLSQCAQASLFNRQDVTCVPFGSGWRLMSVNTGATYGVNNSFDACLLALRSSREGVSCVDQGGGRWSILRLKDKKFLGHHAPIESCIYATDNAYSGRVCAHFGGGRWRVVDIATGAEMSDRLALDACVTQL